MKPRILSEFDLNEFVEFGYTVLRGAFSTEAAAGVRDALWDWMGLDPDDPSGWREPLVWLQESHSGGPFAEALTERFFGAVGDLVGHGAFEKRDSLGWWPITFPGFETETWREPDGG